MDFSLYTFHFIWARTLLSLFNVWCDRWQVTAATDGLAAEATFLIFDISPCLVYIYMIVSFSFNLFFAFFFYKFLCTIIVARDNVGRYSSWHFWSIAYKIQRYTYNTITFAYTRGYIHKFLYNVMCLRHVAVSVTILVVLFVVASESRW